MFPLIIEHFQNLYRLYLRVNFIDNVKSRKTRSCMCCSARHTSLIQGVNTVEQLETLKNYAPSIWSHTLNLKSIHPLGAEIFVTQFFSIITYSEKWQSPTEQKVDIQQHQKCFLTYAKSIWSYKANMKSIHPLGWDFVTKFSLSFHLV